MSEDNIILVIMIGAALSCWIGLQVHELRSLAKSRAREKRDRLAREKRIRQLTNRT